MKWWNRKRWPTWFHHNFCLIRGAWSNVCEHPSSFKLNGRTTGKHTLKKKSSYNSCLILIDSISLKKKKTKTKTKKEKSKKNFLKRGWVAQLIIHLSLSTYLSNLSKRVTNFGISPELKQNNMAINKHYWSSNGKDSALQRSIEKGLSYVNHIINCTILGPL